MSDRRIKYFTCHRCGKVNPDYLSFGVGFPKTLDCLGRAAAAIARRDGIPIEKTHSTVWGEVNAWPVEVWDEALGRMGR